MTFGTTLVYLSLCLLCRYSYFNIVYAAADCPTRNMNYNNFLLPSINVDSVIKSHAPVHALSLTVSSLVSSFFDTVNETNAAV